MEQQQNSDALNPQGIKTGDHVHHAPSNEDWIVAYVEGGRLCPVGWPESLANVSDCTLTNVCSAEARVELLKRLGEATNDAGFYSSDSRAMYARDILHRTKPPLHIEFKTYAELHQEEIEKFSADLSKLGLHVQKVNNTHENHGKSATLVLFQYVQGDLTI